MVAIELADTTNGNEKDQFRYSQVIAENILESPTERDFRDNKNNNVWGMRDLDMRDKVEHNFSVAATDKNCDSCNNCSKL